MNNHLRKMLIVLLTVSPNLFSASLPTQEEAYASVSTLGGRLQEYRDRISQLESSMSQLREDNGQQMQKLQTELSQLSQQRVQTEAQVATVTKAKDALQAQIETLTRQHAEQIEQLTVESERVARQVRALEEQLKAKEQETGRFTARLEEMQRAHQEAELQQAAQRNQALEVAQEEVKKQIEQTQAGSKQELEALRAQVAALQAENEELKKKGATSERDARQLVDLYNYLVRDVLRAPEKRIDIPEDGPVDFNALLRMIREKMAALLESMVTAIAGAGEQAAVRENGYRFMMYQHEMEKIRQQRRGRQVEAFNTFVQKVESEQPGLFKRSREEEQRKKTATPLQSAYKTYIESLIQQDIKSSEEEQAVRLKYGDDQRVRDLAIAHVKANINRISARLEQSETLTQEEARLLSEERNGLEGQMEKLRNLPKQEGTSEAGTSASAQAAIKLHSAAAAKVLTDKGKKPKQ